MAELTPEQIEALQEENKALNSAVAKLEEQAEALVQKNIELEETNEKLNALVASAGKASAAPVASNLPTIEIEGEKYQWKRRKFRLGGSPEVFTIEQAAADNVLLEKLLAIEGQQVLVKQVD